MTVLSLKIPTERDVFLAYKKIDVANKTLIERQMAKILEKMLFPERRASMYALMHDMSKEAEANGLTEDLIDEILKKE
jgi:hypothetical protein